MELPYRHIIVERHNDVFCVRMCRHQMQETDILEMADEVLDLIVDQDCKKMVFSLGPGEVDCLYSVFLAKLVMMRRHMSENGGQFRLSEATPNTLEVFEACHLKDFFEFTKDKASAIASFEPAN
jgi:hypothetical protein